MMSRPKFLNRRFLMLLMLFSGAAAVLSIAERAPMHLNGRFPDVRIHEEFQDYLDRMMNQTLPGPYVYRILAPYLVFLLHKGLASISPLTLDYFLKILILIFCQLAFFQYLRLFFSDTLALAGVLWFDVLASFSLSHIQGPSVIDTTDLMNALVFCLAFRALYLDQFILFGVILFVGTLNRETPWILLPILFLNDWRSGRSKSRLLAAFAAVALPYFGLRWLIETPVPEWINLDRILYNFPFISPRHTPTALVANLHVAFALGPLIMIGLYRFREHPRFLRVVAAVAPLFLLIHYIVGAIIESRLWLPLYLILIPMALNNLEKMFQSESAAKSSSPATS